METHEKVAEKTKIYLPYNILPLDPDSANQAIMRYPEVCLELLSNLVSMYISYYLHSFYEDA